MPLRTTGLPACSQALTLHRAAVPYSPLPALSQGHGLHRVGAAGWGLGQEQP